MAAAPPVSNGLPKDAPVPMEEDKSDPLVDAIEKIIIACEGRNDSRSGVFEASKKKAAATDRSSALEGGGSLRSQELAQLSRLCAAALSPASKGNADKLDFGNVDGELLASLFLLLQVHVRSAAQVDLVSEACQALEPQKSDNGNQEGKKMTMDKVRPVVGEKPETQNMLSTLFVAIVCFFILIRSHH